MTTQLTRHVLVPVADQEDARTTAQTLKPYDFSQITVLHVVEKGEGVPDKTPVEQSEQVAAEAFDAFRETFPDAETEITYRRDVVEGIIEVADEINADAIVFRPRGGARIVQWLSGDRSLRLITEADRPVISIPEGPEE
ncbi:universal stress protein (plasmid) [Salinigranum rubrum]|uniref:Universal stress protein n=1 Tax=Salinigranum rubrum TaxID=755307 RepID=A0A2I8VQB6_9EURY|nr:universal stress protein [Salinigranum rubrum]AUV84120.1 universal stress protein [Salinigranum rubrum]